MQNAESDRPFLEGRSSRAFLLSCLCYFFSSCSCRQKLSTNREMSNVCISERSLGLSVDDSSGTESRTMLALAGVGTSH